LPPFVLTCRNVILRSLATKNLLVVCFERVKNIKQILHCVQDDSQCQPCRFSSSAGERKIMNHFVVSIKILHQLAHQRFRDIR
jgi:hypothetical protein